jgi:sugar phosphate isomerase/epimerase
MWDAGQGSSPEYQVLKNTLIKIRRESAPARLEAIKKSLIELLNYTSSTGIRLGLENRYHYLEFPSPDELEELLGLASPERLGFIYDVGHAQALSRLGFYPYDEWLKRFSSRIIEVHLHDVIGLQDHQVPGQGEVDFNLIATYLPKDAFRTLEFQGFHTHEQVMTGMKVLEQHGCIREEG